MSKQTNPRKTKVPAEGEEAPLTTSRRDFVKASVTASGALALGNSYVKPNILSVGVQNVSHPSGTSSRGRGSSPGKGPDTGKGPGNGTGKPGSNTDALVPDLVIPKSSERPPVVDDGSRTTRSRQTKTTP